MLFADKIQNMKWWDISLIKLSVLFFAFAIVQLIPEINNIDWKIYGGLFLILMIYLLYKFYLKK